MTEKDIVIRFRYDARKALALLTLLFLCWHPALLNSETLTLTTYYPAPYGGYAQLLTTQNTTLARDSGAVGIGVAPSAAFTANGGNYTAKLDMNGHIKTIGNFILHSNGNQYMSGSGYHYIWNYDGMWINAVAGGMKGNLYVGGRLYGVCSEKTYGLNVSGSCAAGEVMMGTRPGNSSATGAVVLASDGVYGVYVNLAAAFTGSFTCCRISAGTPP